MIVAISSFFKISIKRAFSVFKTLPLKGKIAWNLRSLPNFAEPPAESPSTKYNSLSWAFVDWAGVNLPERIFVSDILSFAFLLSFLAFLAASRASLDCFDFKSIFSEFFLFSFNQK